jgi:RNA-directed DNA polymerase
VRPRVREVLRAGARAGGCGNPTGTGVPHGGGARPLGSTLVLTPFDRWRAAEGRRRTRWADAVVGWCQTRAEAQRAVALAERCLREDLGVARHLQKTRMVHGSPGCEGLGYQVKRGSGVRLPAHTRRSRTQPPGL